MYLKSHELSMLRRMDHENTDAHALLDQVGIQRGNLIQRIRAVLAALLNQPRAFPLDLGKTIEVRRYAELGGAYTEQRYTVAAIHEGPGGIRLFCLESESGEVLRIREAHDAA